MEELVLTQTILEALDAKVREITQVKQILVDRYNNSVKAPQADAEYPVPVEDYPVEEDNPKQTSKKGE